MDLIISSDVPAGLILRRACPGIIMELRERWIEIPID